MAEADPLWIRMLTWAVFVLVLGAALILTVVLALGLLEGWVPEAGKYARGVKFLAVDRYGFSAALIWNLIVNGGLWYFAYWLWRNRVQSNG